MRTSKAVSQVDRSKISTPSYDAMPPEKPNAVLSWCYTIERKRERESNKERRKERKEGKGTNMNETVKGGCKRRGVASI